MITDFADEETRIIYAGEASKKLPADIQTTALRKLLQLNVASSLNDLRVPPGNRLEKLSGRREGQWSIRVNAQWRVCFEWTVQNNAARVEIVDYH